MHVPRAAKKSVRMLKHTVALHYVKGKGHALGKACILQLDKLLSTFMQGHVWLLGKACWRRVQLRCESAGSKLLLHRFSLLACAYFDHVIVRMIQPLPSCARTTNLRQRECSNKFDSVRYA
jgi:hypothetical protein